MESASCKALVFAALLTIALPGAGVASTDSALAETIVPERIIAPDDRDADDTSTEESAALAQSWFSTLGALALGVLGVFRMRRRTA